MGAGGRAPGNMLREPGKQNGCGHEDAWAASERDGGTVPTVTIAHLEHAVDDCECHWQKNSLFFFRSAG